jgi:hypothetical protein
MKDRQLRWADFDGMLQNMAGAIVETAAHFGLEHGSQQIEDVVNGPLLSRYSKATEYAYSPSIRGELLLATRRHHRADIDSAIALLHRGADKAPLLGRALERAGVES